MEITDIVNKRFTKSIYGYRVEDVDRFLDEIICELEKEKQEKQLMIMRIEALVEELERKNTAATE